jgi:uncharacterized protein (DUF885 family)
MGGRPPGLGRFHRAGRWGLALAGLLAALSGCHSLAPPAGEDLLLRELVDEYFAARFQFYPAEATAVGVHDFDGELPRLRREDIRLRVTWLKDFRQRLLGVDLTTLSSESYYDALQLSFAVRAELHGLEGEEIWRRSPGFYCEFIASAVEGLVELDFAPPHPRLARLVLRLGQVRSLTEAAEENLDNASRVQIEAALERLEQIERALRALPKAFGAITDQALLGELARANEQAVRAVEGFRARLSESSAPGSFALGKENLRLRLLYGEMEEKELGELRRLGEREMRETADELRRAAAALDPAKPVNVLLEELTRSHPSPSELIAFAEQAVGNLKSWLAERVLVSVPAGAEVRVMVAPPFALATSRVALEPDRPGEGPAFEPRLRVSAPELGWPPDRVEQHLRSMSRPTLLLDVASEVYPGKYLRLAFLNRAPTRVRRLLTAASNLEGWSRYAERLIFEEGFGRDEPGLPLVVLHRELLAYARLVAVIGLHADNLSVAEAQSFFAAEAHLERTAAAREAREAAASPERLLPALGQLQILKLREDFLRLRGEGRLQSFHDAFLACGAPPLRLVRLLLLAEKEGETLPD